MINAPTDAEIWQTWMSMVRRAGVADPVDFARAVLARWCAPSAEQQAATDGYVQPVPDKCDRITWRGRYYHLPLTEQAAPKAAPGVTSEQRRLIGVIADKIEDGTLFQSGIYQKKDLARFVRNMLDVTPTAPAASPTPPAEQQAAPKAAPGESADSLAVPDNCPHILWFDDQDLKPVVFAGDGAKRAALEAYRKASMQWNAHLFVRIAVNSRDCLYPCAAPQQEPVMIYHGRCTIDCGEHGHHDVEMLRMIPAGSKLYTALQPAPAPLSDDVVKDAARRQ